MNIVLDTNTVISAMFWKGAPRQVLDLARSGKYILFTSTDLLAEKEGVVFIDVGKLAPIRSHLTKPKVIAPPLW